MDFIRITLMKSECTALVKNLPMLEKKPRNLKYIAVALQRTL